MLLVNTSDKGGAGKACVRLHLGLLKNSINSKLLLLNKISNYDETYVFLQKSNNSLLSKLKRKALKVFTKFKLLAALKDNTEEQFIQNRADGLEKFSFPNSKYDITESEAYKEADIINLHWVSEFVDYRSFFKKNTKPVVWTLHDMNPFSGGEHYEEPFIGIDKKGFPVKRTFTNEELEQFNKVLKLKQEALGHVNNLHFVTLCDWMTNELKKRDGFNNFPVHQIPNGIDSNIFKIRDKTNSRTLLNIPQHKKVVLFVADLINANRKGFRFLVQAIKKLENSNIQLFVIGNKNETLNQFENIIQYGKITDDELLSSVYSAADVFVIPSLMDNLPNTVLESLLCGTPVIGFPIGGIPDMINHSKNGILAKEISVDALAESISNFLELGVSNTSDTIREEALKKYDDTVQANNYIKLFKSILQ